MECIKQEQRENTLLDLFKLLASFAVVTIHLPHFFEYERYNAYYILWYARFAVPFFFACTGFFFEKSTNKEKMLRRMAWLILFCYVLYLPSVLESANQYASIGAWLRWTLVFGYEYLWYLNATMEGVLLWMLALKLPKASQWFYKLAVPVSVVLLLLGGLLCEHFKLLNIGPLTALGSRLADLGGPRNVVFLGFPMMVLGGWMARREETLRKVPVWVWIVGWFVLRAMALFECRYLMNALGTEFNGDMMLFGMWPALCLVGLSLRVRLPIPERMGKQMRRMAEYVYILHMRLSADIIKHLNPGPVGVWIGTIALCCGVYLLLEKQFALKKQG